MQASNAGEMWVDLQRHVDDKSINMSGQYASWPITGYAAGKPFRFFRLLLQSSPCSCSRAFALSNMELYGYFFKLNTAGVVS